jgi:hypothetical protein
MNRRFLLESLLESKPQLATPTISLNGDILSIEEVENAECYDIYVDGVLEESVPAVSGYTIRAGSQIFDTDSSAQYSLDNGVTWENFNRDGYSQNEIILENVTQIKFKVTNRDFTHGGDSTEISSTTLGLELRIDGFSEDHDEISQNYILNSDINDLYIYCFVD